MRQRTRVAPPMLDRKSARWSARRNERRMAERKGFTCSPSSLTAAVPRRERMHLAALVRRRTLARANESHTKPGHQARSAATCGRQRRLFATGRSRPRRAHTLASGEELPERDAHGCHQAGRGSATKSGRRHCCPLHGCRVSCGHRHLSESGPGAGGCVATRRLSHLRWAQEEGREAGRIGAEWTPSGGVGGRRCTRSVSV